MAHSEEIYLRARLANQLFAEQNGFKDFAKLLAAPFKLPERFPKKSDEAKEVGAEVTHAIAAKYDGNKASLSPERLAELMATKL